MLLQKEFHPTVCENAVLKPRFLKERLVLLAISEERRAWREIQNLCMRFVDPKSEVASPMYCFEGSTLRSSVFARILGSTNLAQ